MAVGLRDNDSSKTQNLPNGSMSQKAGLLPQYDKAVIS
jgi:hypothetical protein